MLALSIDRLQADFPYLVWSHFVLQSTEGHLHWRHHPLSWLLWLSLWAGSDLWLCSLWEAILAWTD